MSAPGATTLRYGAAPSQYALLWAVPAGARARRAHVILVHGGFWRRAHGLCPPSAACETLPPALAAAGLAVAALEYRRVPEEGAAHPGAARDVAAGVAAVCAARGAGAGGAVLVGHSAGGALALVQAAEMARVGAAPLLTVAIAPVADFERAVEMRLSDGGDAVQRYMGGLPADVPDAYREACPSCRRGEMAALRLLVVSGGSDVDVPPVLARDFCADVVRAASDAGSPPQCRLLHIPGADHYDLVNARTRAWRVLMDVLLAVIDSDEATRS